MDILARIKRCALLRRVRFTYKATDERIADALTELEVLESIVNANKIHKTLRSIAPGRKSREHLYVIISPTVLGQLIYTKGKLVDEQGVEIYYLMISAKLAD